MTGKEEFYYDSSDNKTKIHAIRWIPKGNVKAVLQIAHGMLEHMERYDDFATSLASSGILVTGNDHLGHGLSVHTEEDRGYFSAKDGNTAVVEDMHKLRKLTEEKFKGVPYFMLGHSMGSFLLRQYITTHDRLSGAIIVGTGHQPYVLVKAGMAVSRAIATVKGWRHRSLFVNNLAIGSYNKSFEPSRTSVDWLTKEDSIVDEYLADDKINFIFTLNAYYNMFKGMTYLYDRKKLEKIPKDLPVIFLSGAGDPVGNFGKDVPKLCNQFKALGVKDVDFRLYENDRHEIINETDREEVHRHIAKWIEHRISE
ncbi:MAG: alpha/beta hydrolase [Sedimentibacter sp.]|uniref:alpha/beta hydrolase n=1 Tax=Sedimentibacter sp. TaxID=1960295 RepID=UPI003158FF15